MSTKTIDSFFYLIRLGIDHRSSLPVTIIDWEAVKALAAQHGLSAVALDGAYHLSEKKRPEAAFLAAGKAEVAQEFELIYEQYTKVLSQMSKFFPRIAFKFRRWRANAWKHRLCYRESLWSAFWSGVWNHLLKPASI